MPNIESEAYKIVLFIIMRMNVNKVLYVFKDVDQNIYNF